MSILTPPSPSAESLRITTYNIFEGAVGKEEILVNVLRQTESDLIFLQEVLDLASATRMGDRLGMHSFFAPSNASTRNVVLLSRYPLLYQESYHPFPLLRTLLAATIQLPSGIKVNLYGVHLGILHDLWRLYELKVILNYMARHAALQPSAYTAVVGDFNALLPDDRVNLKHGSRVHRLVLALQFVYATRLAPRLLIRIGFRDAFRHLHSHTDGFTFPTLAPAARLDHIFLSPALSKHLTTCEVLTEPAPLLHALSDHLPLIATLEVG